MTITVTSSTLQNQSLFEELAPPKPYLKCIIYGMAGSGKTTLAQSLAIGLSGKNKTVYCIDSEKGLNYHYNHFREAGVKCLQSKAPRIENISVFSQCIKQALADKPDVLIIDSISDIGQLYKNHYAANATNQHSRIQKHGLCNKTFYDEIVNPLKSAPMHVIICGKASIEIDEYAENGGIPKIPHGMGIEHAFDLNIHTNARKITAGETSKDDLKDKPSSLVKQIINVEMNATVVKDRLDKLQGRVFFNPSYEDFREYYDSLNSLASIKYNPATFSELKGSIKEVTNLETLESLKAEIKTRSKEMSTDEIDLLRQDYKLKLEQLKTNQQ